MDAQGRRVATRLARAACLGLALAAVACSAARAPSPASPRPPSESVATSDCAGTRVSLLAAVGETPSSACGTHGPTPAPGSISKEAAISAARKALPGGGGDTRVAWASIEHDPFLEDADRDSRLVWEVRLEGAIAAPACPSGYLDRFALRSDPPCLDIESGIIAVLDPSTGAFLGWLH